eukprot:9153962-Pyramimonas_sp.AAC.1
MKATWCRLSPKCPPPPRPAMCCVRGVDGDVRVRPAGLVHLLLRAQRDPSEEAIFFWTSIKVVESLGREDQTRKLLQISQGLLMHPHSTALSPGVPRVAFP